MGEKMQQKQAKINNTKNSVNEFLNSHDFSNDSIENQNSNAQCLGSTPIDYSNRAFDTQANVEVEISGKSSPDTALDSALPSKEVNPQADSNNGMTRAQINWSPNAPSETTNQTDRPPQRGRPDVTFSDRLQIAARFWNPERAWGEVTDLAAKFGLSRQSIYNISYHYQSLLSAPPVCALPAPIIESSSTIAGQSFTRQEMLNLRARLILTSVFPGGVTMRPLEDISASVPFIDSPSDSTIWRIINQAGEQADEILSQVDYSQIDFPPVLVAVDETFFNGYPIL